MCLPVPCVVYVVLPSIIHYLLHYYSKIKNKRYYYYIRYYIKVWQVRGFLFFFPFSPGTFCIWKCIYFLLYLFFCNILIIQFPTKKNRNGEDIFGIKSRFTSFICTPFTYFVTIWMDVSIYFDIPIRILYK